jgi:Flp pilus assembly protein TadG
MKSSPIVWNRSGWVFRSAERARGLPKEEGGALVEMAITMPVLMLLLTGAASFALAFYNLQQLGNVTASTLQQVAALRGQTDDPCNQAMTLIQAGLPGWNTSNLTYNLTVSWVDIKNNTSGTLAYPSASNGGSTNYSCTPAGNGGAVTTKQAPNAPITLSVSYSNPWFPIFTWPTWFLSPPPSISTAPLAAMAD